MFPMADKMHENFLSTELHAAVEANNSELVEFLLEKNADINIKDGFGRTPLHLASNKGYWNIVKILTKKQRDISCIRAITAGLSLLHVAAENNNSKMIELLVQQGSNVNAMDRENNTPLHYALCNPKPDTSSIAEVIETLLRLGARVDIGNDDAITPLHCAARVCPRDIVVILLRNKETNVNAIDSNGRTPLHHAALPNHEDNVKVLLDHGAQVDIADEDGQLPISYTTSDTIKRILDSTKELLIQSKKGNLRKVKDCLCEGAVVNACGGENKSTPLHYAAWKGHIEIVDLLLKYGANPNTTNRRGNKPVDYASKNSEIQQLLRIRK